MENDIELWKWVAGWEGLYQVSNMGGLKSFKKNKEGRVLSNKNANGWYFNVVLTRSRHEKIYSVKMHTLVANHFLPPKPGVGYQVNHKDANKQNNRWDNLEWVTKSENVIHSLLFNPCQLDGMHKWNKEIKTRRILQFTTDGEFVKKHLNGTEAAKFSGVCRRNILQVANGTEYKPGLKRKQAGGYIWKFEQ